MSKCMGCMKEKGESEVCPHCGYVSPKEQENAAYLPEGTILQDRYLLGRVLGQGGFGITYIGYDNTLDARVAIKEYYPGDIAQRTPGDKTVTPYTQASADYEHGKKRFIEEARTLARFSDFPGIVSVKDCFEEDNTAYMVMQFLEGIDLKEYLKRKGGKISPEEAVSILTPVMDALKEIHRAGIIHRDISPDNIFITTEGQIKLIDFGAARQSLGGGKSLSIQLKPGYAPEEQYRTHGNQGPWTDVYALAATLYRMVTGQVPPEAMERMSYDTLEIPQELPENIRTALQIGLAVRAPERYASVEQFQNALSGKGYVPPNNASGYGGASDKTVASGSNGSYERTVGSGAPGARGAYNGAGNAGAGYAAAEQTGSDPGYYNAGAGKQGASGGTAVPTGNSGKKTASIIAILGTALACVAAVAVIFILVFSNRGTESAPTASNSAAVLATPAPTLAPTLEPYIPPVFTQVTVSGTTSESSSRRNYDGSLVMDGRPDTAWNVPGGQGEWVMLSADTPQQMKGIRVLNGYTKYSPDYGMWIYYANSRPKDITLSFSDGTTMPYTLADTFDNDNYIYQEIDFGETKTVTWVRLTVNSVYAGNRWNDMCISELQPY